MGVMKVFSYMLLFFVLAGCTKEIETRSDLLAYTKKNRSVFLKSRGFKEMQISVKCIPEELFFKFLADTMSKNLTFNFEIVSSAGDFLKRYCQSYEEYRKYKWYLMHEGVNFIYLEQNGVNIAPKIASYEEQYELGRGFEYNIVFDRSEIDPNSAATFVYNDEILGMGKLKFQFDIPLIMKLPINEKSYYNSLL